MRSLDDRSLSIFAVVVVAAMGWPIVARVPRRDTATPPAAMYAARPLASSVRSVAEAIAFTEGYYAAGVHDGRSLPYLLNNPGALKATPIGDRDLDTWGDTGLLIFPTREMGWSALRYQVCLMLTGSSRIYEPGDTLTRVGLKYADGDANWGPNLAARLKIAPDTPLADLAGESSTMVQPSTGRCLEIANQPYGGTHASSSLVVD